MADSRIRAETADGVSIVGFKDSSILDVVTIQQLGKELSDVVAAAPAGRVILDFSDVRFLSSQALGVLVSLQRQADKSKTNLVLCSIRPEIVRIFKITNLDRIFRFFPGRAEALTHFSTG